MKGLGSASDTDSVVKSRGGGENQNSRSEDSNGQKWTVIDFLGADVFYHFSIAFIMLPSELSSFAFGTAGLRHKLSLRGRKEGGRGYLPS